MAQEYSSMRGLAAYFDNQVDAERAIEQLHRSGFRADQIGISYDDLNAETDTKMRDDRRSFWNKVESLFSGDTREEKLNPDESRRLQQHEGGPTFDIPDRYKDRLERGGCLVTVFAPVRLAEAEQILVRNNGELDRNFFGQGAKPIDRGAMANRTGIAGERRIRLFSEHLRVNKERVSKGEVRLRKEVRTEHQTVEVPVTHEELVIERVPVEGQAPATGANIGNSSEVRVPLSEERVVVDKKPVVREEVRVGKRAVEETKTVSDDVRHEELKVDDETKLKNKGVKPGDKRIA